MGGQEEEQMGGPKKGKELTGAGKETYFKGKAGGRSRKFWTTLWMGKENG